MWTSELNVAKPLIIAERLHTTCFYGYICQLVVSIHLHGFKAHYIQYTHKQRGPGTALLQLWNKTSSLCSCLCLPSLLGGFLLFVTLDFCWTSFPVDRKQQQDWRDYKRKVVMEPPRIFLAYFAVFISSEWWKWVRLTRICVVFSGCQPSIFR